MGGGSIKPCNLFEVGARISAARQMGAEVAQVYARSLAESLINMTGDGIDVEAAIDFPVSLPRTKQKNNTTFFISGNSAEHPEARGVVQLENALCVALLERACGGASDTAHPSELLTRAEHRFAERVVSVVLEQVSEALNSGVSLALVQDRDAESGTMKTSDLFLLKATVSAGNVTGTLSVWLPPELTTTSLDNERVCPNDMRTMVGSIPVTITATLSRQSTSLRQVMSLKPGDVLPLKLPGTAEISVGKKSLGHARVVACDGQLALELSEAISARGNIH